MIRSAAFCPHTPLLVPAVDASRVAELVELRAAAQASVKELLASGPERVVVIGTTAEPTHLDESAGADFRGYGVAFAVGGPGRQLELPHAVGAWLLDDAGWSGSRLYTDALEPAEGDAWLVMADGSTKRTDRAPGSFDDRAEAFDAGVVAALAQGDPAALADLDTDLGLGLGATGTALLARVGAALRTQQSPAAAHVRHDGAPLGVGSWVADWTYA